jgi:hypothetical protein
MIYGESWLQSNYSSENTAATPKDRPVAEDNDEDDSPYSLVSRKK